MLVQQLKIFTGHKNITFKNFNTNKVFWCIPILEEYGPDIEYILGKKNIAIDALLRLPNSGNHGNAHESTYITETMPEIYGVDKLSYGTFTLSFKFIDRYQREDPFLPEKLNAKDIKRFLFADTEIL